MQTQRIQNRFTVYARIAYPTREGLSPYEKLEYVESFVPIW